MDVRRNTPVKEENYEHILLCLICRQLFDQHERKPVFLTCHHTFCKMCLKEYAKHANTDEIECPSCRTLTVVPCAGISALQTNFYIKYIQQLVYGSRFVESPQSFICKEHSKELVQYCSLCAEAVCQQCLEDMHYCKNRHEKQRAPIAGAVVELKTALDTATDRAANIILSKKRELESFRQKYADEKDESLMKIDSVFDQHTHFLTRRATLLKHLVVQLYTQKTNKLDEYLDDINTAQICIISFKEYHENLIKNADFARAKEAIAEVKEVQNNITKKMKIQDSKLIFDENHGLEQFKTITKELGRVYCSNDRRFSQNEQPSIKPKEEQKVDEKPKLTLMNQSFHFDDELNPFEQNVDYREDSNKSQRLPDIGQLSLSSSNKPKISIPPSTLPILGKYKMFMPMHSGIEDNKDMKVTKDESICNSSSDSLTDI